MYQLPIKLRPTAKNLYINSYRNVYRGSQIKELRRTPNSHLALTHFDSYYPNIFRKSWPSIRLGLLSPKKSVAILNTFYQDTDIHERFLNLGAVELQKYYGKHQRAYVRYKRSEELKEDEAPIVEMVHDGHSSAEDLQEMFSDRVMDEDERYFVNRASTVLDLNDFVPATEFISIDLDNNMTQSYEGLQDDIDLHIETVEDPHLHIPDNLKIFSYPRQSWELFPQPTQDPIGNIFTHYMIDGASILAVLALDVQPNDVCADYCASPGGKSLGILMTLRPSHLVCNDVSSSRLIRLRKIFTQYLPKVSYVEQTLQVTNKNACDMVYQDTFDRILVDAPCSNDRHSATNIDNNIFKRSRTEERIGLPSLQTNILRAALKSLKVNGVAVYSTCTMSPLENDAVVQKALIQLREEGCDYNFVVMNLKEAFRPLRGLFKFNTHCKYGQLVVPDVRRNFGPMYICKIKRLA